MYSDFDYLFTIINDVDPEIEPISLVSGLDIKQTLKNYRYRIDTISSNGSFINNVIIPSLNICNNKHIDLKDINSTKWYLTMLGNFDKSFLKKTLKYIDTTSFSISNAMYKLVNYRYQTIYFRGLVYIDGKYFTRFPFSYKNKRFDIRQEILSVNGLYPDTIINRFSVFEVNNVRWDKERKKYYSPYFYCSDSLIEPLVFKMKDKNGEEYNIDVSDKSLKWRYFQVMSNIGKVRYFRKYKVLYIRMPIMISDTCKYPELIQKTARNRKINKVVIDIRRNQGGTDLCWMSAIRAIIDTVTITNNILIAKNNEIVRDYLNDTSESKLTLPYLPGNNYFRIYHDADTLYPYGNSIKYRGHIFVLQDENIYSSAMAFSDYAYHSERFITVGTPTGFIGGEGNILLFMLPHSKLIFQMVPILSVTGAKKCEDLYIDVELPVKKDFEQYYNAVKYFKGQRLSKRYLLKEDQYFKAILNYNEM
jgi:hypothetical protein